MELTVKITRLFAAAAALALTAVPAFALDTFNLRGAAKGIPSVVAYKFLGQDVEAVFVRGPGDLMYAQVGNADGSTWTPWAPIGSEALKGSPSCAATTPSRIDCFGLGSGNAIYHIAYDAKANSWTDWESLGGLGTSDPSAVRTAEGGAAKLRVYVRGPGNVLFVNTKPKSTSDWSDWKSLGVTFGGAPACTDIFKSAVHCYDTSSGQAEQYSNLTKTSGADVFIDHLGGMITGKASAFTRGAAGDTLMVMVNGPGKRLWMKKWHTEWQDWVQLPVVVGSTSPACTSASSAVWCADVESDGSVKAIRIDNSEL